MSLIRLIIIAILIYFAVKLVQNFLKTPKKKSHIKGSPKPKKTLDLSDADIEDADYKDISDD
jgi:hypothetical protein